MSLGGWLVTFMLRVRSGEAFASGMVVTGFWLGLTFGRIVLGFVTGKIGEKLAIVAYIVICMGLQLCFWLIPNFISSAIFAGWLGFFLGPLFPAAIVVATKLLPQRLHVSAIGFAAAFGGGGAAVLPFAVGAIAQAKGVQVLQPIVLAILAAILALWCMLRKSPLARKVSPFGEDQFPNYSYSHSRWVQEERPGRGAEAEGTGRGWKTRGRERDERKLEWPPKTQKETFWCCVNVLPYSRLQRSQDDNRFEKLPSSKVHRSIFVHPIKEMETR